MVRLYSLLIATFFLVLPASALQRVQGYCSQGGVQGQIPSTITPITPRFQASYPGCTVNVYLPGTLTPATIYSDANSTPKGNPFAANAQTGYWFFYVASTTAPSTIDVNLSGAGIPAPFTLSYQLGVEIPLPLSVANGGTGTSTPALIPGKHVQITGSWPDQTINAIGPIYYSTDYNYAPITPGVNLAAGTPATITLSNGCPAGVAGANTKQYEYLSGGTGAAEAVLITGGTCTSGASSGTLTFTPANSHTGTWTIQSATSGITEAEYAVLAANPGGGEVYMPAGVYQLLAAIPFKPNMLFQGEGVGTSLLPANCNATVFDANVPVKSNDEYGLIEDNIHFQDFLIDGNQCLPGINGAYGIKELNSPSSTEFASIVGVQIERVYFNNIYHAIYLERSTKTTVRDVHTYYNSTIVFTDAAMVNFPNNETLIDHLIYTWHPMNSQTQQATMTDAPVLCVYCEVFTVTNSWMASRPTVGQPAIEMRGGEDLQIANNEIEGFYTGVLLTSVALTDLGQTIYAGYVNIHDNSIDQIHGYGIRAENGVSGSGFGRVDHLLISDNLLTNMTTLDINNGNAVFLGNFTSNVTMSGNLFGGITNAAQIELLVGPFANTVKIDPSNIFSNDFAANLGTAVEVIGSATNITGLNTVGPCDNFTTCVIDGASSIASANTLSLPTGRVFTTITGTTQINIIAAQKAGTVVTLLIPGVLTVKDHFGSGGNIFLGSDFVSSGVDSSTLTLYCNGANWFKLSGSAN